MDVRVVTSLDQIQPLLGRICAIADENRGTFGFLPKSAYIELAAREQLWVAETTTNKLAGYLLFGSGKGRVRIFQVFVDERERKKGIGTRFLHELRRYAQRLGYQTISARVAADLAANSFWDREGFRIIRQVRGGQTTNRLINERVYEVLGSSLWEPSTTEPAVQLLPIQQPILSLPNYAIDLNALFDVVRDREHAELMREVISNALNNEYRLCVTSEFAKELERTSTAPFNDPILSFAKGLPTLPSVPKTTLEPLVDHLRVMIFPEPGRSPTRSANDQSDLTHLALCIHHKASGFITRESAILRKAHALMKDYGLEVLAPADLTAGESKSLHAPIGTHTSVSGHTFTVGLFNEARRRDIEAFLVARGLATSTINSILDPGTKSAPRNRIVFHLDSKLIGVGTWGPVTKKGKEVRLFVLVDEDVSESQKAVDHILECAALSTPTDQFTKIALMTLASQTATRDTARKRGFVLTDRGANAGDLVLTVRYAYSGLVAEKNWPRFAEQLEALTSFKITRRWPTHPELMHTGLLFEAANSNDKRLVPLFELETVLAPALIVGKDRPTVITPIREDYANELIPPAMKQFALFAKEAPMHLERAYFGRPGLERLFTRGALVVFYVLGARNEAVGLARVTASGRYAVQEAATVFARQGVLTSEELERVSVDNAVGVFTFDSYRNFRKALPFRELRGRGFVNEANLITSQKIGSAQLLELLSTEIG